jgi:P4 family phage/plasmid primase-like protien
MNKSTPQKNEHHSFLDQEPDTENKTLRSNVYTSLMSCLDISKDHWLSLQARGFEIEHIAQNGYRTMNEKSRDYIGEWLEQEEYKEHGITKEEISTIPGFYISDDGKSVQFRGSLGTYIPVRNKDGYIIGIKVRRDGDDGSKYVYISSKAVGGTGPGAKVHTPLFFGTNLDIIRITEGELKADIATAVSGILTLSIPGVGNWRLAVKEVAHYQPKKVLVALDADYKKNPMVAAALICLVTELKSLGIHVSIEDFQLDPSNGIKGIDDALAKRAAISLIEGREQDSLLEQLKNEFQISEIQPDEEPDQSVDVETHTPADLCDLFMKEKALINSEGVPLLRFWNERLFRYNGSVYQRSTKQELSDEVLVFLRGKPELRYLATPREADNIFANIRASVRIPQNEKENGVFLDDLQRSGRTLIPLANGLLDLTDALKKDGKPVLLPHDPRIINFHRLPYDYDPSAHCPRWEKIMRDFFGDENDTISLIQEWFGYQLIPDTSFEAMMMLIGDGSNGKSLVTNAMSELVGHENCSSVGLEQIRADRTFTLVPMIGKLANIIGEVSEVCKPAQDLLKQIVSGDPVAVDEKYDAVMPSVRFYCRITMSSNNPPRFSDRSDGIWRRLITVPFTRQFKGEEKDQSLKSPTYWRDSGELPGLFNWALEGLLRLKRNGKFTTSERVEVEKARYQSDCNPAKEFIRSHCESWTPEAGRNDSRFYTSQPALYKAYREDALNSGNQPLAAQAFANEVIRIFPKVVRGKNPESFEGGKVRLWKGIRFHPDGFNPNEDATLKPIPTLFDGEPEDDWDDDATLASL